VRCALSPPPWGFWPVAFAGLFLVDRAVAGAPAGARFRRGWLAGVGLLGPSTLWMLVFTPPGYVVQVVVFAALLGGCLALVPGDRWRWLALPGAWTLFEAVKGRFPFGGVPLSELAIGQVGGPLGGLARVGGVLLIALVTVAGGVALSAAWERRWRVAGGVLAGMVVAAGLAAVAPSGETTGRTISVALVQGGGEQGTTDEETDDRAVFLAHLEASEAVPEGTDLTVWPENVVNVDGPIATVREGGELAALARRKDTTLVVGVVEGEGEDHFRNAAVVFAPDGRIIARYEKVRRVPFGEYVPFRGVLEGIAGDALPDKDAIVGTTTNTLDTPAARIGVVISWEVFFGDRGRDAVNGRGEVADLLLNPTNGSSYTGTLVQTQQVGSSRLRAIETGRAEAQIAPTGFTAFVSPTGEVQQRTGVGEQKVLTQDMPLRTGRTLYLRWGAWPPFLLALALLVAARVLAVRSPAGG
jgi:apolipoprotein N-acyltransferase